MGLSRIDIRNLRILKAVSLLPGNGLNLIVGANGAGKTSLLEGIYLLGRGRSFRSAQVRTFVREGEKCVEVTGWRAAPAERVAGIRRCVEGTEIRIDGQTVNKMSALAREFPVQLVTPRSHELLERGPDFRRRFLDWGVFHVEPGYLALTARYQRVLRQRNEALKTTPGTAFVWDDQLASYGEQIDRARQNYLPALGESYKWVAAAIGLSEDAAFSLSRGWQSDGSLHQALGAKRNADRHNGYTSAGPHRADLRIRVSGTPAETRLSRGQQKLLVLALTLAQMKTIGEMTSIEPILLIDDLAAELDAGARARVTAFLRTLRGQAFITSLEEALLGLSSGDRLFHVEQGKLSV